MVIEILTKWHRVEHSPIIFFEEDAQEWVNHTMMR